MRFVGGEAGCESVNLGWNAFQGGDEALCGRVFIRKDLHRSYEERLRY